MHKESNYIEGSNKVQQNRSIYIILAATQKNPKYGFEDRLSLNAGQKHCRMLQGLMQVKSIAESSKA